MASTLKSIMLSLLFSIYTFSQLVSSHDQHHPLDPLTPSEFTLVRTIVKKSYPYNNLTFQFIGLDELDNPTVLSWLSNPASKPAPRRAFVITRMVNQSHEIVVDLLNRSVVYHTVHNGHGYPLFTNDEQFAAIELAQTYEPFLESIQKRGLNISDVVCDTFSIGWFREVETKRLLKLAAMLLYQWDY
jgi:primary-amine oxidase